MKAGEGQRKLRFQALGPQYGAVRRVGKLVQDGGLADAGRATDDERPGASGTGLVEKRPPASSLGVSDVQDAGTVLRRSCGGPVVGSFARLRAVSSAAPRR